MAGLFEGQIEAATEEFTVDQFQFALDNKITFHINAFLNTDLTAKQTIIPLGKNNLDPMEKVKQRASEFLEFIGNIIESKDDIKDVNPSILMDNMNHSQEIVKMSSHLQKISHPSHMESFQIISHFLNQNVPQQASRIGKKYGELRSENPNYLVALLSKMKLLMQNQLKLMDASIWAHHVLSNNFVEIVNTWDQKFEQFYFIEEKKTPLLWAAERNNHLFWKFVLNKASILFFKDSSNSTSLHSFVVKSDWIRFKDLLKKAYKYNLNLIDETGGEKVETALHMCLRAKNWNAVKELLETGASYNILDKENIMPKDLCGNNKKLANLFEKLELLFQYTVNGKYKEFPMDTIKKEDREMYLSARDFKSGLSVFEILCNQKK